MIRRHWLAALAALTLSGTQLVALPFGNPLDATWLTKEVLWEEDCVDDSCDCDENISWCDAWSLRFGYYSDFVFNRRLEVDDAENDSNIRRTVLFTNAAYLAFNVYDAIDFFATIGGSKLYVHTPVSAFPQDGVIINETLNIEFDADFSWSMGARANIWECGRLGVGLEGQFFEYKGQVKYLDLQGGSPAYFNHASTCYREWQIGIGTTYVIPICDCSTFVVPYFGIKWAHAKLEFGDMLATVSNGTTLTTLQLVRLESQRDFGWAVGLTFVGNQRWDITAEARFFDETALHVNSQVRF